MTAMSATHMFPEYGARIGANTIVAWLISRIKRKQPSDKRRSGNARLSDATLSDLGITREQAEFGMRQ